MQSTLYMPFTYMPLGGEAGDGGKGDGGMAPIFGQSLRLRYSNRAVMILKLQALLLSIIHAYSTVTH